MGTRSLARDAELLSVEEARRRLFEKFSLPLRRTRIPVEEALGRVLAEDVVAPFDRPRYDEAFYDGYALRSEDTAGATEERPARLKIVGSMSTLDEPSSMKLAEGQAAYVPCGAPLPLGADAVLRLEEAAVDGGELIVTRKLKPMESVIRRATDFGRGEVLLRRGRVLRPQDLCLLMEIGASEVEVLERPRAVLVPVGSDLTERARRGVRFPDNYARMVALFLELLGVSTRVSPPIPDEPKLVEGAIEESLLEADLVLAVGGVSVSREDVVPSVVREMGEIVFHGVAVSPGKVSGFAVIRDKPLFMVPAHVGSTMACLLLFVAPAISSALTGNDDPYVVVSARLTRDARGRADRAALKFFALEREGSEINARPVEGPLGGSPLITMLTKSSGFAVIGPREAKRAGELIEARLLPYTLMYA